MPQGCSTKTYIFPLLSVKVITRSSGREWGWGWRVFIQVCFVELGEFSSHTTPWEAAWWEHCLWLSLSLSLSLIIFIMLAFSYAPACVSRSHIPTLSSPYLFVSAAFFRSERCCGTGLPSRNKAEFSIHISASVPPSYFSTSLLQLSFCTSVLSFFFFYPLHHHPQFNPPPPLPSTPFSSHS